MNIGSYKLNLKSRIKQAIRFEIEMIRNLPIQVVLRLYTVYIQNCLTCRIHWWRCLELSPSKKELLMIFWTCQILFLKISWTGKSKFLIHTKDGVDAWARDFDTFDTWHLCQNHFLKSPHNLRHEFRILWGKSSHVMNLNTYSCFLKIWTYCRSNINLTPTGSSPPMKCRFPQASKRQIYYTFHGFLCHFKEYFNLCDETILKDQNLSRTWGTFYNLFIRNWVLPECLLRWIPKINPKSEYP